MREEKQAVPRDHFRPSASKMSLSNGRPLFARIPFPVSSGVLDVGAPSFPGVRRRLVGVSERE
jgi:hypothetical protein